jgi:hypothetical protein
LGKIRAKFTFDLRMCGFAPGGTDKDAETGFGFLIE